MSYQSAFAKEFLDEVQGWIHRNGEVLAMIRFHAAAGAKEFWITSSFEQFRQMLEALPARTCITVFHDRQLRVRGKVDPELVTDAASSVSEDGEWLVIDLQRTVAGRQSWIHYAADVGRDTLRAELETRWGDNVAIGAYPPWLEDSAVVISAVIPDSDGRVVTGIY